MSWQEYDKESTESLIEYIQWKDDPDYNDASKDAFRAFCFRFQKDLVEKSRIICKNWGYDREVGDLIAERTFERFWKYPKTFDYTKCKKEIDQCVIFYLYRFAQNLLSDYRKEISGDDFNPYTGDEEIIRDFLNIERRRDLRRIYKIIEKALNRLTPKHKIIYLTYKAHQREGYKLPRQLLKSLREELDLTQASIQVYKKEAFEKVDEYLKIYGSK